MRNNIQKMIGAGLLFSAPLVVSAQMFDPTYPLSIINGLRAILILAVPVVTALAVALFIWGLVVFIKNSGDESALEEGKRKMVWGVIALFVIVSVWGLVELMQEITDVDGKAGVSAPAVPQ